MIRRSSHKITAVLLLIQFLGWMQLGLSHSLCRCDHLLANSSIGDVRMGTGCCGMPALQKTGGMPAHHQTVIVPVDAGSCCDDVPAAPPAKMSGCCRGEKTPAKASSAEFPPQYCAASCQATEIQQNKLFYVLPPPLLDILSEVVTVLIIPDSNPHFERERYAHKFFSLPEHSPPKYLLNLALLI